MTRQFVDVTPEDLVADRELYFETCIRIRDQKKRIVPLVLKPAQQKLFAAIDHERRNGRLPYIIILKARREGFSTAVQAENFREAHLGKNSNSLVIAHTTETAEYLFEMSRRMYAHLPPALQYKTRYSTKRLIHFDENDTSVRVEVAGEVRGYDANAIHASEFAFWAEPEKAFTSMMQAVPEDPSSLIVIESTANGVGNLYHELWVKARQGANQFVAIFSPWFDEPDYRRKTDLTIEDLTSEELERMERYKIDIEQVAWYRHRLENRLNGDLDKMRQEFPENEEEAFLYSGRHVYDPEGLKHYGSLIPPAEGAPELPPQVEIEKGEQPSKPNIRVIHRGRLRIYRKPERRHRYIIGIDPSEGDSGGDLSPCVITNRHTLDVDAAWVGRTPPEQLAEHACTLGWYYNEALANPEANNHGHTLIYTMQMLGYRNFFYRKSNPDGITGKPTDKIGWDTKEQTRAFLFNCTREYVYRRIGRLPDPDLIHQLNVIRYDEKTGKPDHPKGEFMDVVVAWGLTLVAHKDFPDQALRPLDSAELAAASQLVNEIRRRQSVGHSIEDLDLLGLTCEELERLDDAKLRRDRLRGRFAKKAMR